MTFFNENSRKFQDQFDSRRIADRITETRLHHEFSDSDREVIGSAAMFFLASVSSDGRPDCSVKGGNPGFVQIVENNTLLFPEYDGNGMFRSMGNIVSHPYIGLLFFELNGAGRKLRINGTATVSDDPALLARMPGAKLVVKVVDLDIFPNCPRYLPKMTLEAGSKYNPALDYAPPDPLWKSKPEFIDYLPLAASETA
jgi:predicted pyridoxine 5'-phosphate oxidase superfamily flavin-nucleotide-binding protein